MIAADTQLVPHQQPRSRGGSNALQAQGQAGAHARPPRGQSGAHERHRALVTTWHFRLLHIAGVMLALPMVCLARLLPSRWRFGGKESVFVEANRVVLTALGFAFMA